MRGLARHEHDAKLLERPGADGLRVPGEDELRAWLRASLLRKEVPDPCGVHWRYARWKPGRSLCLGYELEFAGEERLWVAWKRYVDSQDRCPGQAEHTRSPPAEDARLTRAKTRLDDRTWLSVYPCDRMLPGLPRALDLQRRARDLQPLEELARLRLRWRRSGAELLRYKPERRAVLRLEWGATDAEGRSHVRTHALRVLTLRAASRCLAARRALDIPEIPRLLAARPDHGLLYEQWLELEPEGPGADEAGALLAHLHAQELPQGVPACPRLAPREELEPLFALDAALQRRACAIPLLDSAGTEAWSHGDFRLDQLGRSERGPVLLDLDSLGRAPRERDLASWIADAFVARPDAPLSEAFDAALEPYARAGGTPPAAPELRQAVGAELVRRAAAGIRRLEAGALERAELLLEQAAACSAPRAQALPPLALTLAALETLLDTDAHAAVERCDLDERGRATLMLAQPAGPRWFREEQGLPLELRLGEDARLPGALLAGELVARGEGRLVSWRPGRRFVLLLPERVRKGVRAARYTATLQRQEDIARACQGVSFRVARVLARDAARATFDLERLPGRALDFGADASRAPALARALQELGALDLPGLALHARSSELQLLDRLADRHARAAGSLPPGWERLLERLEPDREGGKRLVVAHRDLFEAQVLVERERIGLLDFDLACKAEAELDPANLLAHLDLGRARGRVAAREAEAFEDAFTGACVEHGCADRRALRFYRCASLLRLALVWGLRARGRELSRALTARAEVLLDA